MAGGIHRVNRVVSNPANPWPFSSSVPAQERPRLKSAWTLARAMSEAYKGGYKGNEHFRDWLKRNKLDDRSEKQIEMLGEKWGEGVVAEAEKGRKGTGGYKAPSARQRAQILRDTVSEYKEAKGDVDFDMLNPKRNNPGPGTGHWVEFESVKAAKQYARLMEGEGKRVLVWRDKVRVEDEENSTNPKTIDGYPVVKKESDAYALYDATDHEVIGYAPGHPWPLSKTKALREKGSGHKVYYVGFPAKENPAQSGALQLMVTKKLYPDEDLQKHHDVRSVTSGTPVEIIKQSSGGRPMSTRYLIKADFYGTPYYGWVDPQNLGNYETGETMKIDKQGRKRNPESSAGDMYESFHGAPSQELVTYHDEEHYHEYLSELGVCCGLLVECVDGTNQAIGLSGYEWAGKGKGQGFVEGRENPKRKKGPIGQSAEMLEDWAGQADSVLGKVLTGNPKDPATMSASEINKALDKYDAENEKLMHQFIEAGRGHERPSEYLKLDDPLSRKAREIYQKRSAVAAERDRRYGPGTPSRLPSGRGFGPIKGYNPRRNPDTQPDPVSPNTTLLCSNEDGTQLYLQGGDQSLDLESLGITGDCATKELIVIGEAVKIYYETCKDFDDYEVIQYHHELGEVSGEVPILAYDRMNERLMLVGGAYKIEKPAFETSPGIEN